MSSYATLWIRASFLTIALFCPLFPLRAAVDAEVDVLVAVTVSEAGKKVERPSKQKPVYYIPIIAGYHEEGKIVAGEKVPNREDVLKRVHRSLAKEGYLFDPTLKNKPSLLICLEWGSINPLTSEMTLDASSSSSEESSTENTVVDFNRNERARYLTGNIASELESMPTGPRDKVLTALSDDRYFFILTAYDFSEARMNRKKTPLWRARMSAASQGVDLAAVIPALLESGAPYFGRETVIPQFKQNAIAPNGEVRIGESQVISTEAPRKD